MVDLEHISDEEVETLIACTSENEWNKACEKIKQVRGGKYPFDWYHRIILSGLMNDIASKWGSSDKITIDSF